MPSTDSHNGQIQGAGQSPSDATVYTGGVVGSREEIFKVGQIVGGSYEVLQYLGRGAMGMVYKVKHSTMGSEYALKVLSADFLNANAILRFQNEAQALAKLNHPNVIAIYNFGLHDDRLPFYVMEFLSGDNLLDKLDAHGPMPIQVALPVFIEVCGGLSYAHRKGILHRDVKPANFVMLNAPDVRGARVKVVDFGLVKFAEEVKPDVQKLTAMGEVCGSPSYMSPEQTAGQKIDPRADIYSLGCSLFQALTGKLPFRGRTATETMMMQHEAEVPTLASQGDGRTFPEDLDLLIQKMMAKAPMDRYQSMELVAQDLRNIMENKPLGTPPLAPLPEFGTGTGTYNAAPMMRTSQSQTAGPIAGGAMERSQSMRAADFSQSSEPSGAITSRMRRDERGRPVAGRGIEHSREEKPAAIKKAAVIGAVSIFILGLLGGGAYLLHQVSKPADLKTVSQKAASTAKGAAPAGAAEGASKSGEKLFQISESASILRDVDTDSESHRADLTKIKLTSEKYFSHSEKINGRDCIVFDFPKATRAVPFNLGTLYTDREHAYLVEGHQVIPKTKRMTYQPTRDGLHVPGFLEKFRPGEITGMLCNPWLGEQEIFFQIPRFKGFTRLTMDDCAQVNDKFLPTLFSLSLTDLSANNVHFDGSKLARAPFLQNLQSLQLTNCKHVSDVLKVIAGSKKLETLNVAGCNLTGSDYQLISKLPSLKKLNISGSKVTAQDWKQLSRLSNLEEFCAYFTHFVDVSPAEELSHFPKLKQLMICEQCIRRSDMKLLLDRKPDLRVREAPANSLDHDRFALKIRYGMD